MGATTGDKLPAYIIILIITDNNESEIPFSKILYH